MGPRAFLTLFSAVFIGFFAPPPALAQAEGGDSILVLDASGSMWGQIEGEAKITIAKQVLGDLLKDLPADRRLGLVAYGHRRKGDCADIEEIASVGAERAAISSAVEGLNPKGKTPMADAVKLAAEKLKYTEEKATVILVSDGIETCAPDPCGVAAALEKAGVDFTVHVVGFDVSEENAQAQLRCIAENTGGMFVSAQDASSLGEALNETVIEAADAPPPASNLYLRATELEGGIVIEEGLTWRVTPSGGGDAALAEEGAGVVETSVAPGSYDIAVERPSDGLKGAAKGVIVREGAQKTVTIALTFPVEATIRLEPETEAMAGTNIKVHWTGPDRKGDYIKIAEAGGDGYKTYEYVSRGNPAELRMPVEPGDYEVSYMLGRPLRALATAPIKATPATATLQAPETAIAGETIAVEFTGPPAGSGDWVTVVKPDAPGQKFNDYAYIRNGSPAELRMPLEAGDYEIRYVQGGRSVIARQAIKVTEALATLTAPDTAAAGETVKVEFTGPPAGSGDWITVVKPDAPGNKYNDYAYIRNGSPADLRMPLEAGNYEIRYVQGGKTVIARRPIVVTAVEASVSGPSTAVAGEMVAIEFSGPKPGSGDWITVTKSDAPGQKFNDYYYTNKGSPGELRMPLEPGEYELRFIQGRNKIIARQPVTVTEATASLSAKETAVAGETISVEFTGPKAAQGDWLTVVAPDAPGNKFNDYHYTKNGSPGSLRMPLDAGDYEIRFIQGGKKVLARKPIMVTPARAELIGPATAKAGERAEVEFTGPPYGAGDYVAVAEPDADDLKYIHYASAQNGASATLRMPDEPGDYELRFIQGHKKLLARKPIKVTP
ncbi:VWA domain-containing protein [Hyphococcus luteus]|uniref:VWFA domain-containing protein n=1 Tax=Hyphococcus luteus TaxID=2058213 RepID=A0A2S7K6B3_9PROT|nr:VWA domain-containing protein [Marinicaulis flavus]PQA88043.1 hypothetical protein CW354_06835 [Marinicaulis flavus]